MPLGDSPKATPVASNMIAGNIHFLAVLTFPVDSMQLPNKLNNNVAASRVTFV
jgi:hypothetical protein